MPGQHKYSPIRFRPPEPDRLRLKALAEKTGEAVNAIIARALHRLLDEVEQAGNRDGDPRALDLPDLELRDTPRGEQ